MRIISRAIVILLLAHGKVLAAGPRPPIGVNLNGLSYWSGSLPFIDAFKTASEWVSGTAETWGDKRKLDLDSRGWVRRLAPGQIAYATLFSRVSKIPGLLPRRWVVAYEGRGTLEYSDTARLIERRPRRDLIEIAPGQDGDAVLGLVATDPRDPLRNIRITPEKSKTPPSEVFNPLFLERLKGYRVLRMMIWQFGESAQDSAASRWKDRALPRDARWSIKGAPIEVMVALANKLSADPWFGITHEADDDYVRRFAGLVKKTLHPKRKVYLEYSNEVWNDHYPATAYARDRGLALKLSEDPYEATMRFYAKRAAEVFSIWEQVLGKGRLVRVLSFQFDGMPEYSDEIALSFGDTRKHVDAIAVGPYFGTELASDAASVERTRKMNLDELFRELETSSLPKAKAQMLAHAAVAKKYGLPLIAYEGGQHLWNMSGIEAPELDALYRAANRDPRMGELYTRYLNDWAEAGGGLFMHLTDCGGFEQPGNWGALEYLTQPRERAPKYDALMRFMGR